jgi:hypothetical protein
MVLVFSLISTMQSMKDIGRTTSSMDRVLRLGVNQEVPRLLI